MEKDQELEHLSRLLVIFCQALGEGGRELLTLIAKFELLGVEKLNQRKAQKGEFCPCCFLSRCGRLIPAEAERVISPSGSISSVSVMLECCVVVGHWGMHRGVLGKCLLQGPAAAQVGISDGPLSTGCSFPLCWDLVYPSAAPTEPAQPLELCPWCWRVGGKQGGCQHKVMNCWPKLGPPEGVKLPAVTSERFQSLWSSLSGWTQLFSHFPHLGLWEHRVSSKKVEECICS